MKKQLQVYFSGRVQGVGFRFTVRELADELDVGGWVKNLPDGRVQLVAEAEEEVLKKLLLSIHHSFARYIRDTDVQWLAAGGTFNNFQISA
ncbi:MAG: acylphosphatase [Candidatus Omnitrophica bacterium]|nr:acylphosphatase [Candidatus Omnitrophota bacterium]